jgi:hypothetical protein
METRLTKHQHHAGIHKSVSFEASEHSIDLCNRIVLNERERVKTARHSIVPAIVGVVVARSKAGIYIQTTEYLGVATASPNSLLQGRP